MSGLTEQAFTRLTFTTDLASAAAQADLATDRPDRFLPATTPT
ncbi:hypothetical protein ABZW49_40355 [Nonomuraea wenchangensis]